MLDEELQNKVLKFYYEKWLLDIWNIHRIGELLEVEDFKCDERTLYANADYLVDHGFLESPMTSMYSTKLTISGVLEIERKELSLDSRDRRKVLEHLKQIYDENPDRRMSKSALMKNLEIENKKIERIVWYLDELDLVDISWYGGEFDVIISSTGIDYLREPTDLENEREVMAYAYKLFMN